VNRAEAKAYIDSLTPEQLAELDSLLGFDEMAKLAALLAINTAAAEPEDD
jgi:hypothetical protein